MSVFLHPSLGAIQLHKIHVFSYSFEQIFSSILMKKNSTEYEFVLIMFALTIVPNFL